MTSNFSLERFKQVQVKMSGDLGSMWSQGCSEEVARLLIPCQALPGCVVGIVVHQGKLKETLAANELVIFPYLHRSAVCCTGQAG